MKFTVYKKYKITAEYFSRKYVNSFKKEMDCKLNRNTK